MNKPSWQAEATPRYNKKRKKLPDRIKELLTAEEEKILVDPQKGDRKKAALKDVWVEKFQAGNDQYLVAYTIEGKRKRIIFIDIGQHENFYRDLQKYLKSR